MKSAQSRDSDQMWCTETHPHPSWKHSHTRPLLSTQENYIAYTQAANLYIFDIGIGQFSSWKDISIEGMKLLVSNSSSRMEATLYSDIWVSVTPVQLSHSRVTSPNL